MDFLIKMKINMQFCLIFATFLIFSELAQQTSQIRMNNSATIRLRKDTEIRLNETNQNPANKSSLDQVPSFQQPIPNVRQTPERPYIHFPNLNKTILKKQSENPSSNRSAASKLIKATETKTTNPLLPKLPSKLIDGKVISNNKIGQSANFSSKAESGQLSIKQTPENLQARRLPTDTKLVSESNVKLKKPVLERESSPAKMLKNPSDPVSNQESVNKGNNLKQSRKSDELSIQSSTESLKPSRITRLPIAMKENRSLNSSQVVPKFKNLMILSRLYSFST